ncbi:response regulator transcription factor [Traorella massiliensis]|uniref:response regulator transcription factor n=1 Tax=Traorella massiliensis TaxID=1903263 RepID=UPI0023529F7D|nr:response regulator transcription factor [Traorella massiliensis]
MATIYIVEDDLNIREIETFALKNSGYSVVDFECAKDFYKKLDEKVPNLIILDIMLPDEDGLSIVQRLRKKADTKNVPVLLISAKTSEIDVVKGLDMGADDYLTKPFGVMELISRVKALLRRSSYSENEKVLSLREILMDDEKRSVYVNDEAIELTFKEYELLKLLLINSGIVLTREKLMEKVWGTDFEGESRTLDMHIKTLRQKLKSAGSYIKTIRNVGYMLE